MRFLKERLNFPNIVISFQTREFFIVFFLFTNERRLQSMLHYSFQAGFLCNQTLPADRNSSHLSTLLLVISGKTVLSITATLRNALIVVAFRKEPSLNPPLKLFLRCLPFSDLYLGLIVQSPGAVFLLAAFYHRWYFCRITELL